MKMIKLQFHKVSFPRLLLCLCNFFCTSGTLLSHSQIEKSTRWNLCSHFKGNLCRHTVYSGQYLACKGCSSEFCFALFSLMTSSDIPHREMGMQKTVKAKAWHLIICVKVHLTLSPGSIHSYLSRSNILCLPLESYLQTMAADCSWIRAPPLCVASCDLFISKNLGY